MLDLEFFKIFIFLGLILVFVRYMLYLANKEEEKEFKSRRHKSSKAWYFHFSGIIALVNNWKGWKNKFGDFSRVKSWVPLWGSYYLTIEILPLPIN